MASKAASKPKPSFKRIRLGIGLKELRAALPLSLLFNNKKSGNAVLFIPDLGFVIESRLSSKANLKLDHPNSALFLIPIVSLLYIDYQITITSSRALKALVIPLQDIINNEELYFKESVLELHEQESSIFFPFLSSPDKSIEAKVNINFLRDILTTNIASVSRHAVLDVHNEYTAWSSRVGKDRFNLSVSGLNEDVFPSWFVKVINQLSMGNKNMVSWINLPQ